MSSFWGFHFHFVCILRRVRCSLVCVPLYLVLSWRTRHWPGHVSVAGHPHIWQKQDKLLIDLAYCIWLLWARSQGHNHKTYVSIGRARPHISPTPYNHTQLSAHDLQPIHLDDYHPPREPPRSILSQLGRELRAMLKFQFPRLNNEAIGFGLA